MHQQNENKYSNTTESSNSTKQNQFSNRDQYGSVEPLPESSRPRRDGPGGEDGE